MQYRNMPNMTEQLSVLGFGCMRLPTSGLSIDRVRAKEQIRMAIDAGVNYLDTAYPYHMGASESFLGEEVLLDGYREKVYLATKLPCFFIKRSEQIEEYFRKQLKKLNTDHIDFYLLHALNLETWQRMVSLGIKDFMDKIRADGTVKHMGFSFHADLNEFKVIVDDYNWEFCQVQYNIIDQHYQAGIEGIQYAYDKGLGIIIMEPLRGGGLSINVPKEAMDVYRSHSPDRSAAEWALKWIWNNPMVSVVLSGMNEDEHINENVRVACESLPDSMSETELQVVDKVKNIYESMLQVPCTGCGYCLPCPAGINIPSAFKHLNDYHMFQKRSAKMMHIQMSGIRTKDGKSHFTHMCIDCGACETKCPQHIQIRKEFKKVRRYLEGPFARLLAWGGRMFYRTRKQKETQ